MGILRSIGLTGKQLCRMNIVDGMCYAFFAVLAVFIVGVPVSVVICMEVSKKSFAGKIVPYQFPFLEMGLFILVLFGMELILSGRSAGRKNNLWQSRFISIYDIIMHFTLLFTPNVIYLRKISVLYAEIFFFTPNSNLYNLFLFFKKTIDKPFKMCGFFLIKSEKSLLIRKNCSLFN